MGQPPETFSGYANDVGVQFRRFTKNTT